MGVYHLYPTKNMSTRFKNNGITHLEDLHHSRFISTLKNLSNYTITEKLDGANLVFGFDDTGKFYTSQESKRGERYYNSQEFENIPQNNTFKSAHLAIESIASTLLPVVGVGNAIEVEVLFGPQPNAIVYGLNYIVLLRMLPRDSQNTNNISIEEISRVVANENITIQTHTLTSKTGLDLIVSDECQQWKITIPQQIDTNVLTNVNINKNLTKLERWLEQCGEKSTISNAELLDLNLNCIPKHQREEIKQLRELAKKQAKMFKLNIKNQYIVSVLNNITPNLRSITIPDSENYGIEGIVLRHNLTGEQVKIVDKELFTTINGFYHAVRNKLKVTNLNRPQFECINLSQLTEYDMFGAFLKPLSTILNLYPIAYYSDISRSIKKYKGITIDDTIDNILRCDVNTVSSLQNQALLAIQHSISILISANNYYNINYTNFKHTLSNGKTITYTKAIHERTLISFAEMHLFLRQLYSSTLKSNTKHDIIYTLFKKQLNSIHKT